MPKRKKNMEVTNGMIASDESHASSNQSLLQEIYEMRSKGEVNSPKFVSKMRQMEVLLGISEISPFGTNEMEIFEENLAEMNLSDMQKLALKIGINPYLEKPTLKKNLIREFFAYTRNSRRNIMPTSTESFVPDPKNPKHQELMKLITDI
jgi:hypothetical protein